MQPPLLSVSFYRDQETRSSALYNWDLQHHGKNPFVIIQLTLEGEGCWERQSKITRVPPHHAFIAVIPERGRYFFPPDASAPWTFCWLNCDSPFDIKLWRTFKDRFGSVLPLAPGSPAAAAFAHLRVLLNTQADAWTLSEALYSFHLQWWRQLEQPHDRVRDPVAWVESHLQRHYRQPITIKQLAEHLHMSREHLTRLFLEKHRLGPSTYLRNLRVKSARELMKSGDLPLGEIALRTGFQSIRQLRRALALKLFQ